ncbi:LacI family DNA-binding transcriptional regulator [Hoeflea sp. TYP-13]|uniref:LacI family DNA-binding transcriptional regulator n=1 Tax=Hoeflea sp. TYP-13 TaxID=3230023 RepID=UPI0034C651F2
MSKKNKITSVDVARRAGVSQSAVSRAFSRVPTQSGVSDKTRKRIMQAAGELGYRPNALARSLITQKSKIVALLFSYLDNQFYALALEKLCLELQGQGYHALVFMIPATDEGVDDIVSELLEYQVDGIITASVELSSSLCEFCSVQNVPVVMFNRVQDDDRLSSITTDNVTGGRMAAKHFLETGHRKIALMAGWQRASTSRDREFGFRAELRTQGVELFDFVVGHFHLGETRQASRALMNRPEAKRPDAVFAVNDYMALEAMSSIRSELKLRIPEDVSIMGFDDIPLAAMPEFSLTTLRQPINQMVSNAVRLMIEAIDNADPVPEKLALTPTLIKRGSTRT